jgi:hypothetical protein
MPSDSQLSGQGFPSDRPVNGAFQWLALLGEALASWPRFFCSGSGWLLPHLRWTVPAASKSLRAC